MNDKNLNGKVLWFDRRDGNGIIVTDSGYEFYFDISVLRNCSSDNIKRGLHVQFEINSKIKDCACATNVKPNQPTNQGE
jgi:cold shock CspA family protein